MDPNAGDAIARLPWVADGIVDVESSALKSLYKIAVVDGETSRRVNAYAWFVDGVTDEEQRTLAKLHELTETSLPVARMTAALPWTTDSIVERERETIRWLEWLAKADSELALLVTGLPWIENDITETDRTAVFHLAGLANTDLALAQRIAGFTWFPDGPPSDHEGQLIGALWRLARTDLPQAQRVADFPWLTDDITEAEDRVLYSLNRLYDTDPALAQRVAALPWFADDITEVEWGVLIALSDTGPEMARAWLDEVHDDEAMALMAALAFARTSNYRGGSLYNDLLDAHFVQSATVSLPLAGEVNLWAFQSEPFPPGEDVTAMIEDAARATEGIMGLPFPAKDVILIIQIVEDTGLVKGINAHGFITVERVESQPIDRGIIYHEVAHYYFHFGPRWISEGGADFMELYTNDRVGLKSLEDQRPETWRTVEGVCHTQGIGNIHQLNEQQSQKFDFVYLCNYDMGAYFLMELYEVLGEEAFSAAIRAYHLEFQHLTGVVFIYEEGRRVLKDEKDFNRVEKVFFQTFLRNTPPERVDAFREVYRRLYGGPHAN